jgi:hypothetical protein
VERIHELTRIDPWFLHSIEPIVRVYRELKQKSGWKKIEYGGCGTGATTASRSVAWKTSTLAQNASKPSTVRWLRDIWPLAPTLKPASKEWPEFGLRLLRPTLRS